MCYYHRLRILRESRGLTQREVAAGLGILPRTYCSYESGSRRIPVNHLIFLARFFDCSMDYLSGAGEERTPYPDC